MKFSLLYLIYLLLSLGVPSLSFTQEHTLFIIKSESILPFNKSETALLKFLSSQNTKLNIKTFNIKNNWKNYPIKAINKENPTLIVTIGSVATKIAYKTKLEQETHPNIIATMILQANLLGIKNTPFITGIELQIPYDKQFELIKKIVPHVKKIGTLYHHLNHKSIKKINTIATRHNLELIAYETSLHSELSQNLEMLLKKEKIDLFLPIIDPLVYSNEALQYIILKTAQNKIPFVGISAAYLKWGALFSLDINFKQVGYQTGQLIQDILTTPQKINAGF